MNEFIQNNIQFLNELDISVISIVVFLISFLICYKMLPLIIITVQYKKLMDHPNERSSHSKITPTLAGVAFFASLMIAFFFIKGFDFDNISLNLMAALTILFFLGLKDDLMVLSSKTKIILQTLAIIFVIVKPDLQIISFNGFLGLNDVPLWFTIPVSYFIILYIINAYNLIDGIDGLAALLGILIASIFGVFFFVLNIYFYALISVIIVGFLMAFLRYNLSEKKKIFMGDTGSMIVGFLLGILTLRFLVLDPEKLQSINISPENIFIVTLSILFFPVIDVIRVLAIRFINGRAPFSADRSHLHHVFIDKGLPHLKASLTLMVSGIFAFLIIYLINSFVNYIGLIILFVIISFITFYLLLLLDTDDVARKHRKKMKTYIPKPIYKREFEIRKSIIVFLKKVFYKDLL